MKEIKNQNKYKGMKIKRKHEAGGVIQILGVQIINQHKAQSNGIVPKKIQLCSNKKHAKWAPKGVCIAK